jgi:hypothetical protein
MSMLQWLQQRRQRFGHSRIDPVADSRRRDAVVPAPPAAWACTTTCSAPSQRIEWRTAPTGLIDVATGTLREILVAPPGFPRSACYSPDGRTLATGGLGRVLLWDLSDQ